MLLKLGFLALTTATIVSVVLSTNIVVVRQLNPDTTFPPFADLVSNPQCSSSTCPDRSFCAGGRCCMCQCLYGNPNVFVNRTSLRCMSYGETNRLSSAHCQYSFRNPNEPLEVIPLTEQATGKIRFKSNSVRVNCTTNGLSVDEWHFLDGNGRWQNGVGDVFVVDFRIVGGQDGNKKDMTFLNWNAKLDAKYAGLIIKLSLSCGGTSVGCILAKINGTYRYSGEPVTSGAPTGTTPRPSPEPSLGPSQGTSLGPSLGPSAGPSSRTSQEPSSGHPLGPSMVRSDVPFVPGTDWSSTVKGPTQSEVKQQSPEEKVASNITLPAVGAIGGLICLICVVCLIVALYKRRRKRMSKQAPEDPEVDSGEISEDHQDPVYAVVPGEDDTQTTDNPLYTKCYPTEEQDMRRSKLDPLPALPAVESRDPNTIPLLAREV